VCPSNNPGIDFGGAVLPSIGLKSSGNFRYSSFGLNFAVFQDPAIPPGLGDSDPVVPIALLQEPVNTTMFFDSKYITMAGPQVDVTCKNPSGPFGWDNFPAHPRHSEGFNVNFADGHAKWYGRRGSIPGTSPSGNTTVPTYALPCDLSGIPGATPDT
jgi:prepilin-type processing-associated H-X9-DG protein